MSEEPAADGSATERWRPSRRRFVTGVAGAASTGVLTGVGSVAAGDATSIAPRGVLEYEQPAEAVVHDDGATVFATTGKGFAVVDVSDPANPTELARHEPVMPEVTDGPVPRVMDLRLDGDRLVVAGPYDGTTYGETGGFAVFDVTDPTSPTREVAHPLNHGVHNVHLDGDHVYLAGTNRARSPMVAFDVGDEEPTEVSTWSPYERGWIPNTLHDLYVVDDVAYCCYWDLGTWLVDVSNPAEPYATARLTFDDIEVDVSTTRLEMPGNSHYAQPRPDGQVLAVGKEAFEDESTEAQGSPGPIELWTVGGSGEPSRAFAIDPPEVAAGQLNTAHNLGWRGDRLYASWYRGGVSVYDTADPSSPTLVGQWQSPDVASFWTAKPTADGFVATSFYGAPETPGLYTFPEPGDDGEPAPAFDTYAPAEVETFDEPTPTPTATATASPTPTDTPTGTATETTAPATSTPTDTTTTGAPGMGVVSALGALGLAGYRYLSDDAD